MRRRFGSSALDAAAAEARRFREWSRAWLSRWRAAPHARYATELAELNALLARARLVRELVHAESGRLEVVERVIIGAAAELIALLAAQVAALVAAEAPALVKRCAGSVDFLKAA